MHLLSTSKTLVLSALLSLASISHVISMEQISAASVSSRESVRLFSNSKDIVVEDKNAGYRIEKHQMNPLLIEVLQRKALGKFTENRQGYIRVKQLSDGKYALEAKVRGDGGGYYLGEALYWGTKIVAYGAMAFTVKKIIEQSPLMRENKDTVIGGATNAALYTTARPLVARNAPAIGTAFVVGGLEKTSDKTQNEVKEKVIGTLVVTGGGKVIGYIEAGALTMRALGCMVWWLP